MRRGMGVVCLVLWCVAMVGFAQDATLTMWTFPDPDRGPNDLAVANDGQIVLAFYAGMAVGRFDPVDSTLVAWTLETSPDSIALTEYGIFYTLPLWNSLGLLDPEGATTLEWRAPEFDPRRLVAADSGPGTVNLYLAERSVGRIAAFEPASIALESGDAVPLDRVTLDAVTTTIAAETATVEPEVFPAPDGWAPTMVELDETVDEPFRDWSVDLGGMDLYVDDITVGGDGGIWYVQGMAAALGVVIPWDGLGAIYPLPTDTDASAVAAGPDESIWFADIVGRRHLGRLDPGTGDVTRWSIALDCFQPYSFVFDDAGGVWFSDREADAIFCFDPASGAIRRWALLEGTRPLTLAISEPGVFWFASEGLNAVGRLVVP